MQSPFVLHSLSNISTLHVVRIGQNVASYIYSVEDVICQGGGDIIVVDNDC